MTALDEKLVLHLTETFQGWLDEPRTDGLILDAAALATRAAASVAVYQSSASKAALPEEVAEVVDYLQGDVDGAVMTPERRAILAKAVTLLSALAVGAQTAEAVAAKSKEEALETLRAIADSNPEAYDECCGSGVQTSYDEPPECCAQPIRDNAGRAKAREAIFALALKSSRPGAPLADNNAPTPDQ